MHVPATVKHGLKRFGKYWGEVLLARTGLNVMDKS